MLLIEKLSTYLELKLKNDFILFVFVFIIFSASLLTYNYADPDLFARLATGKLINDLGYVSEADPFSFIEKKNIWVDHEWLSGVVFYKLYHYGGEKTLLLFRFFIDSLTIWFLIRAQSLKESCKKISTNNRSFYRIFLLIPVIFSSGYVWGSPVRCQVFTYLFISVLLYAIQLLKFRNSWRYFVLMPLIFFTWANLHGGFALGLILFFIACIEIFLVKASKVSYLGTLFALSALIPLINPYGFDYYIYILEALRMQRPGIVEWEAVSIFAPEYLVLNILSLFLFLGVFLDYKENKKTDLFALIWLVLTAYFAYSHKRFVAVFLFVLYVYGFPYFGHFFTYVFSPTKSPSSLASSLLISAHTFLVLVFVSSIFFLLNNFSRYTQRLNYSSYPVMALDYLERAGKGGRLLVDFNLGSYALWRLYPRYLVSIDGRYEEVYPQSSVDLVAKAYSYNEYEHRESLQKIQADYVLLPKVHWVNTKLSFWKDFREFYCDTKFCILDKK